MGHTRHLAAEPAFWFSSPLPWMGIKWLNCAALNGLNGSNFDGETSNFVWKPSSANVMKKISLLWDTRSLFRECFSLQHVFFISLTEIIFYNSTQRNVSSRLFHNVRLWEKCFWASGRHMTMLLHDLAIMWNSLQSLTHFSGAWLSRAFITENC